MPEAAAGWRVAVCTWFGVGHLRPAPGTWGSLAAAALALPVLLAASPADARWILLAAVAAATAAGIACAPAAIRRLGLADPPAVVIDEVAGCWLAIALLPDHALASPVTALVLAVALFRAFDIAKPWPLAWLEGLPRGWGIMADDLAAGICAGGLGAALAA